MSTLAGARLEEMADIRSTEKRKLSFYAPVSPLPV